ncbi:uncharacterized protein LOC110903122 isoform X3 [Helianthus annuus]|uniref:uncharacterized protein LOC110903122 isoform X3 n=1 Tax=Helianthus annuus TaxID=4232 RepID=UPI000B8FD221|nr:uncharacterized protein LOC110903122 isoform X3 [Helianthus annuus]
MRETETAAPAAVPVAGNDNRADIGDGKGGLFFSGQFRLCSVQSFGSSYIPLSSGICPLEARLVMVISIAPMLKMYQYGPKSCFHKNKADFGIKIPMAVFVLILCNHDFMH